MTSPILIDGSQGEGGGQVLRSALTLSAVTGRPFKIINIRAGREKPGLRPQHLTAVRALAAVTGAVVEGARKGSPVVSFHPGPVTAGCHQFNVGTAGAVTLIIQTLAVPLAHAGGDSLIGLTGGTHVPWSPSVDYLHDQWLPLAERMGLQAGLRLHRAGFYPAGGGMIGFEVRGGAGKRLCPMVLDARGPLQALTLRVILHGLSPDIARRMIDRARGRLRAVLADHGLAPIDPSERIVTPGADGLGVAFHLHAGFEGASFCAGVLGAKGKQAERVTDEACDALATFLVTDATMDEHAADQLLVPCALAGGLSVYRTPRVTGHLVTNANVIRQFLDVPIRIEGEMGGPGAVRVGG